MRVSVVNETKKTEVATQTKVASSMVSRAIGLLGTKELPAGEGLLLRPCTSIHTFFMKYAIDVIFLDAQGIVIAKSTLTPWQISPMHWRASGALELPAGTAQRTQTEVGDHLLIKTASSEKGEAAAGDLSEANASEHPFVKGGN